MEIEKEGFPFTKVDHVGIIVRDLDKAVQYYESLGFGPFKPLERSSPNVERLVHGKPANDVKNLIMMGQMGGLLVELLQPFSGKSTQKEFLDKQGEGINHMGFIVSDLDQAVDAMVRKGFKVISRTRRADGGGAAYLDTDKVGGVQFEFIKL